MEFALKRTSRQFCPARSRPMPRVVHIAGSGSICRSSFGHAVSAGGWMAWSCAGGAATAGLACAAAGLAAGGLALVAAAGGRLREHKQISHANAFGSSLMNVQLLHCQDILTVQLRAHRGHTQCTMHYSERSQPEARRNSQCTKFSIFTL